MERRRRRALGIGLAFALLASNAAYAGEQAAGIKEAFNLDGLWGRGEIRTDPTTVAGIGYVHPMQLDIGPVLGEFVAIGTAKGVGVLGCADDYDPLWSVYRDGELGGVYHCYDIATDSYGVGGNPLFELRRTACNGASRWVLWWNSVVRACLTSSATYASRAIVMLETTGPGTTDRNIDVKYSSLYKNFVASFDWFPFGDCDFSPSFADPNYDLDGTSNYACNVFLPPLS